ncbi:MAG: YraN family protein [Candidatus Buchananbacteria bacterium]|nr:YraN family protein [Candidatus Buchananbacteria bacterium]
MFSKKTVGRLGEDLAANFLRDQGYTILARNYVTRRGEIDIVCKKNKTIIFVEVKTRSNNTCGYPEEAITKTKAAHLINSAFEYMKYTKQSWQIDLITVELFRHQPPVITHWPQIIDETAHS